MNIIFKKTGLLILSLSVLIISTNTVFAANAVSKYFSGIKAFRITFTQKTIEIESSDSKISRGLLVVQSPDKFFLEYTEPYKLIYVADGKKLWSYDEDLEQVIVKSQSNILINTPAMILSQPQNIEKKYKIVDLGSELQVARFKLIPKQKNSTFEYIIIGFIDGDLKLMEMIDNFGQHTQLRFNKIERNPDLKSSIFNFVPPEGVDVITDEVAS